MKKWGWLTIRAGFSLVLLSLLFWKTDFHQFSGVFRNMNIFLFLVSFLSYMLLFILMAYRWQVLLRVLGITIPIRRLYKTYLVGVFFNNFLPTTIGGDIARGYNLYQFTQKGKETAVSVVVERFLGFTSLLIIGVAGLALSYSSLRDPLLAWLILFAIFAYFITLIVVLTPTTFLLTDRFLYKFNFRKLDLKMHRIPEVISVYRSSPYILLRLIIFSLLLQTIAILIYYILCYSLHLDIPLLYVFFFFPIINIVSMIPISLGGLGIREGISVYLFQKIGIVSAHAMGLSLAWYSIILCISAIGGIIYALGNADQMPPPVSTV